MSLGWWKDALINWGKKSLIFLCVFAVLAWLRFMNEDVAWNMLIAKTRAEDTWRATWRENNPDAKKEDGDIFAPDFVSWFEYWHGYPPSVPSQWLENLTKKYVSGSLPLEREALVELKAKNDAENFKNPSPSLPPVKLNTESITPLSREKLRFHEDIVRSLLN